MRSDIEIVAELLREQHKTDVTGQDLQEIQEFLWLRSRTQLSTLSAPSDIGYTAIDLEYDSVGKALGFIVGAVLGVLFLPALGLAAGWLAGALIGGALGYRLASLFEGGAQSTPTKPSDTTLFRFSGVGGLIILGSPVPKIYGNRYNNPDGGVYLNDPGQIYTRVTSAKGSRFLDQVYVLSAGRLGEVNIAGLRLDDKPLSDWEAGDIAISVTSGFHDQGQVSPLAVDYSQALPVSTNGFVGLAPAVKLGVPDFSSQPINGLSDTNITYSGSDFAKTVGIAAGWNAGYVSVNFGLLGEYGSYCQISSKFRPKDLQPVRGTIGLSNTSAPGLDPSSMWAGLEIDGGVWKYWANGAVVESGFLYSAPGADVLIEIRSYRSYPAGYLQIFLNGYEIVRRINHTAADINSQWATWSIFSAETAVIEPQAVSRAAADNNDIMPGIGRRFRVGANSINKLRSGQIYRSEFGPSDISIVGKDAAARWVEFNQDAWLANISVPTLVAAPIVVIGLLNGASTSLMVAYRASVTTTKRVTGAELLLQANIFARNNNNDLVPHAQAFRVVVVDKNSNSYEASRFILISTDEKPTIRSITIIGLPLDIYTFKIYPLSSKEITSNILSLEDAETRTTISPPGLIIGGQQALVLVESGMQISPTDAAAKMSFDGKARTSSDSGPSMQITHINELVSAATPPTYPGFTIGHTRAIASDRLQSAPSISWDIPKGAITRQYMAYGTTITDPNPNRISVSESALIPGAVVRGDMVRLLGFGNRVITQAINLNTVECAPWVCPITTIANSPRIAVSAGNYAGILVGMPILAPGVPADAVVIAKLPNNTLLIGDEWERRRVATASNFVSATFNAPLPQTSDEEAVFFSVDSSNYFPDLYVDRLINPIDGLGNFVDQDYFIDYKSIVYARRYCVKNKFFYDGVFSDGTFEAWAVATAPSSLLYCTEINGRFALIPQEGATAAPFIFNDSNTSKYVEPGVSWQQEAVNTLLVKYQDNRGKELQLKLQTTAAANLLEEEIAQTITLQGVNSKAQTLKVGTVALKSIKLQTHVNQFETDVEKGLYCIQGDIVRTQHTTVEYEGQDNGFVLAVEPTTNNRLTTVRSVTTRAITSGYLVTDEPHRLAPGISDSVVITGNSNGANNATYPAGSWSHVDATSLIVSPAQGVSGTGGTLAIRRQVFDQVITVSEKITLTPQHRISIAHKDRTTEENLLITDLGGGRYLITGVEQSIAPGDAWILSTLGSQQKYWRITSMKPDIKTNTVSITGVLWDDDVLNPTEVVEVV